MNEHPAPPSGHGVPSPGSLPTDGPGSGGALPEAGWPVGAVSERLGVAAPTLRSWDRRHGVGPSLRTSGNHRRYTELDIRRVELMSRLTAQGVQAQGAADSVLAMDGDAILRHLDGDGVQADDGPSVPGVGSAAGPAESQDRAGAGGDVSDLVEAIVGAARALDARTMSQIYRQVLRRRDVGRAWVEVFAPALRRVGDLWEEGRLGVQSEHLTSELLQSELRAVVRANRLRTAGPEVMLASADDEQHHLPLLALEAELARHGVASLLLGPRVPSEALLSALRESRSGAIFLWASLARPDDEPFWRGLDVVDWPLEVVIGGPDWPPGVVVPEGPVSLTRVGDLGSAVRAILGSPGGLRH